ncbi:HNH endonuclease signature motif containing protein, partial [Kribbella sp. VKM Ac-2566]|uniref:HNH endonuclease signature motif containing protein n=1 Tax=Kribbella sp. VKM Ac-2566 TaxID=2512218 RepID=UPI0010638AFD
VVHTADKIQQMWVVIQAMADLAKRPTPTTNPHHTNDQTPATHPTGKPSTATTDAAPGARTTKSESSANSNSNAKSNAKSNATPNATPSAKSDGAGGDDVTGTVGSGVDFSGEPAEMESGQRAKDERNVEQRRADVVADVFEHMLHNGLDWLGRRLPDQHRRRPHIEILVPITTLLGVDDNPCELTGYGPIPAEMARRIARDGTWRRLLTDPTNGTVLEASTHRHDPGTVVTETLLARHPVCAWPGCNRTSRQCDRDHATPFKQSGRTNLTGLVPYCEYHHVIKDTPTWGWKTTTHPDGSVTLTAPTGHRYTTVPPARGPIAQNHNENHNDQQPRIHPPTGQPSTRQPSADPPPF